MWVNMTLQPKTNADNLDSMRWLDILWFDSAGTGGGAGTTLSINDRSYKVPGTVTNAGNSFIYRGRLEQFAASNMIYGVAPFCFNGYLRITPYNAYGNGAAVDYGPNGNVNGAAMPGGATIPGAGAPPGGGGGGGSSYCPVPSARIRLPSGETVTAGDLVDGMEVLGFRERNFDAPMVGKVRYVSHEVSPLLYAVKFADGRVLRFSKDHRLCSVARGWVPVQQLRPGEQLVAQRDSVVAEVLADGPGDVVGFVVEGPHTYFTDDVLSHNLKPSVP